MWSRLEAAFALLRHEEGDARSFVPSLHARRGLAGRAGAPPANAPAAPANAPETPAARPAVASPGPASATANDRARDGPGGTADVA
jgi:hypothetical protein